ARAAGGLVRACVAASSGSYTKAGRLLNEAAARLDADAPTTLRLRFVSDRARVKDAAAKLDDAVRLGQEALALADRLDIGWWQSDARSNLAYSYYQAGQLEQAERLNAEARVLAEKLGLGKLDEGKRSVRAAIAIEERRGSPASMAENLKELGDALERALDLKGALAAYQEHRTLAGEVYRRDQQQAILELQEEFDNE